jgi:hypothetical protein
MSEAKLRTGSKCEDLKSSPVRIGGFEMTSHANKSLLINFDAVEGLSDQCTSSGIQYYHVSKIKQYGWLIYS